MSRRPRYAWAKLLILGAGPRLAGAAVIAALLWAGYFWATNVSGPS